MEDYESTLDDAVTEAQDIYDHYDGQTVADLEDWINSAVAEVVRLIRAGASEAEGLIDERDDRISELENQVAELEQRVGELEAEES